MLLAIDIGNSSIKFGVFDGDMLASKFSITTNREADANDLKRVAGGNLTQAVTAAIVCSVVPEIDEAMRAFLERNFEIIPVFVNNSFDFGLKINYEPLSAAGTDRLVNAFAAIEKYGVPCIVCSFGTATTIDAVNSNREYLGGVIAPGMATMAKALHLNTSKLPEVEIARPERLIGTSTAGSIQSGIFYGYMGLVEGIISRMQNELLSVPPAVAGGLSEDPRVIATGGFAGLIAENCDAIDVVDENLTLDGLRMLHNRSEPPA